MIAAGLLVLTQTRGAYLGIGAAAVVVLVAAAAPRGALDRRLLTAGAFAITAAARVIVAVALGAGPERLRSSQTLDERFDLWRASGAMITDRPLLGWRPDQFATNYGRYRVSSERGPQGAYEAYAASPHNEALMVLLSGGAVAGAAYAVMLGATAARAVRVVASPRRAAGVALAAGFVAYLVQAQFSINDVALNMTAMTLAGAIVGLSVRRSLAPRRALVRWPAATAGAMAGAACVMLAALLVAADVAHARADGTLATHAVRARAKLAWRLNPAQAVYADGLADAYAAAARRGDSTRDARMLALRERERRIARFGAEPRHELAAASDASLLADASDAMEQHFAAARALDPKNRGIDVAIDEIRRGATP